MKAGRICTRVSTTCTWICPCTQHPLLFNSFMHVHVPTYEKMKLTLYQTNYCTCILTSGNEQGTSLHENIWIISSMKKSTVHEFLKTDLSCLRMVENESERDKSLTSCRGLRQNSRKILPPPIALLSINRLHTIKSNFWTLFERKIKMFTHSISLIYGTCVI